MKSLRLEVYGQSVKIITHDSFALRCVIEFCRSMVKYKVERQLDTSDGNYRMVTVKVPDGVYAATPADKSYYGIHRGQLDDFLNYLKRCGVLDSEIERIDVPAYNAQSVSLPMKPKWKDKDYQTPVIDYIVDDGTLKVLPVQTGKGKSQPLDALLNTPTGWMQMGEAKVGDSVIGSDGTPRSIIGVYPQGIESVYRITYADGRVARASGDHLWETHTRDGQTTVQTTLAIRDALRNKSGGIYIPLLSHKPAPSTDNSLTWYNIGTQFANETLPVLSSPVGYLDSTVRQRWWMLQGLLDSHGIYDPRGVVFYIDPDANRSSMVQQLVWSLGGYAKLVTRKDSTYRVQIRLPAPPDGCVLQHNVGVLPTHPSLTLRVVSVVYEQDTHTQCIAVDSDDRLYVTNDYIITHNTYMALKAASRIGERVMIVTRGGYIDKWVEDVEKTYDVDRDRVLVVKGCKALKAAIEKAKLDELDFDIIMISTGGYSDYIKQYEGFRGTELGDTYFDPRGFGMLFKVGIRIVDEAHQLLNAYYKIDLYSHFNKVVFLSATIIANDTFEKRIHAIIYPAHAQYRGVEWKKYIDAVAYYYNLKQPRKAKYLDRRRNYSHVMYEQYLMRTREELANYLKMIGGFAKNFLGSRLEGQCYMIFASTVEFCNQVVRYLRKRFPDITVNRYTAEDNLDEIYNCDIIVTTPQSGGTGIDVPNLAKVLATCAVSSAKLNVQMLGRLRELVNYPGSNPEFQYLVCRDIPKQLAYHHQKVEQFKGKVRSQRTMGTGAAV